MRQNAVFPFYRKCVSDLNEVYAYIKSQFDGDYVTDLCNLRGYVGDDQRNLIADMQIGLCNISPEYVADYQETLNLLTKNGNFLLNERYIIPVEGVNGDLVSLIGYYPDTRKYITLPTPFFSKECMFFNFKQAYDLAWEEYGGRVILVEGIFDCLSLRAIGLPAMATMGASVSKIKGELLKLFSKVLGIPDDDTVGRQSLNRWSKKGWQVPSNTIMLKFHGGELEIGGDLFHCKDMDNFVSWYEADDVRETLLSCFDSNEEIEELAI